MPITVDQDTGIKNIKGFYEEIKKELKNNDQVVIDFSGVERIHLAIATVILSAYREGKKDKKIIKLKNISDVVRNQLYLAGFNI